MDGGIGTEPELGGQIVDGFFQKMKPFLWSLATFYYWFSFPVSSKFKKIGKNFEEIGPTGDKLGYVWWLNSVFIFKNCIFTVFN